MHVGKTPFHNGGFGILRVSLGVFENGFAVAELLFYPRALLAQGFPASDALDQLRLALRHFLLLELQSLFSEFNLGDSRMAKLHGLCA